MKIECDVREPEFRNVVAVDASLERLGTGFGFTEGPVWDPRNKRVIFSDMMHDHMRSWSERGGIETFRRPSNKANGNAFDRQGRLVSCEHSTSRVVRELSDGALDVVAAHLDGQELNSPNDIVVRSDGSIYFTDPTYGRIREDLGLLRPLELGFQGVYRIVPGESPLLLAGDFEQPNGLCFSIDEKRLFVNDTVRKHIRVFDVTPQGELTNGRVWADVVGDKPGVPDGMKTDVAGNIFCTGPGGLQVFDPEARLLGIIELPERPANMVFGDDDLGTLYLTAQTSLYRFRTRTRGLSPY